MKTRWGPVKQNELEKVYCISGKYNLCFLEVNHKYLSSTSKTNQVWYLGEHRMIATFGSLGAVQLMFN